MPKQNKRWTQKIESVFGADLMDIRNYQAAKDALPQLYDVETALTAEYCGQPVQDGFLSLMKPNPKPNPTMPAKLKPLRDLMDLAMDTPQYQRLRANSVGNPISAGIGASAFMSEVFGRMPDEMTEAAKKTYEQQTEADEQQAAAEQQDKLADILDQWAEDKREKASDLADQMADAQNAKAFSDLQNQSAEANNDAAKNEAQAEEHRERSRWNSELAEQASQEAAASYAQFEQSLDDNRAQLTAAANNAAGNADQDAQALNDFVKAFSLAAGGDPARIDPETVKQAMRVLATNPNLDDLADWLGWARRATDAAWRESDKGTTRFVGFKLQQVNPATVTAFERVSALGLFGQAAQDAHQLRAVERRVKHRRYEGNRPQNKGPLMLIADQSGSTAGAVQAFIKAIEFRLIEIARRDNRDFYSIPFSGAGQFHVYQAQTQPDAEGLADHLSNMYGGGTEPYGPLNAALGIIEDQALEADILLLTDDQFALPRPEFLEELANMPTQTKIVTIVIGGWANHAAEQFSDLVINITDLRKGKEQLQQAFKTLF